MKIQDITENRVISNVHPLIAEAALKLSDSNKYRIEYVDRFTVIIWNTTNTLIPPRTGGRKANWKARESLWSE